MKYEGIVYWSRFCEKCDKLIDKLNSMNIGYTFSHVNPNLTGYPLYKYYLQCTGDNYNYCYVFDPFQYYRIKPILDDEMCMVKIFLKATNEGKCVI